MFTKTFTSADQLISITSQTAADRRMDRQNLI